MAIASEVSILSKNSLAITDVHAKKTQHIQLFENPLPGTPPPCGLGSVQKVSRECPQSVKKVSWTSADTLGTLFGHSEVRGPKGPGDTSWDTPSDTPRFRGHSRGHSSGTLRARKTPVAGRGVRKAVLGMTTQHKLQPFVLDCRVDIPTLTPPPPFSKKNLSKQIKSQKNLTIAQQTPGLGSHGPVKLPGKGKSAKVGRRGCNRSFAPGEQKASCTGVAPVQKRFWVVQKTLGRPLLPGSKRPCAPSPNHFGRFSLFGPRSAASADPRRATNWRCIAAFPFLQGLEASKAQHYKWGLHCSTNWRCTAALFRQFVRVGGF